MVGQIDPGNLVCREFTGRFMNRISLVAALGGLLFGYDTAIISGTIPFIKAYFSLDEYGLGWAVGCILIGCAAGALIAGQLMDKIGRRKVLLICALFFALSGIGAGLSQLEWIFVVFRITGGLAVGAAAMVSPVYIAEIAPAEKRGRLVSVYQLAIMTGILLAYFANYLLVDIGADNWRWMFASQAFPALVFFIFLLFVPETPRYLIGKGKTKEALLVLEKSVGPPNAKTEIQAIQQSFKTHRPAGFLDVFNGQNRKVLFIGIIIAIFQQITGINAILYYAPVIFKETGIASSNALLQTIGIGGVNLLVTFVAIGFVDKVGRKKFLFTGSVVMAISLLAVALCFQFRFFSHYLVLIFMLVYVAAFGCTLGAVTWVYLSEVFPNRIRAIAISVATLALWLADFIVTSTFPILTQKLGTALTLSAYAACCILSAIYVYTKVPETKGRSLEEIEALLDNK